MKLTIYSGEKANVESWTDDLEKYLRSIFTGANTGFSQNSITCREALYRKLEKYYVVSTIKDINYPTIAVSRIGGNENIDSVEELIRYSKELKDKFMVTKEKTLISHDPRINPMLWSALILIIKKYSRYYKFNDPNSIPIKILDNILNKSINHYEIDYIFTAFYIYLLFNPNFSVSKFYASAHVNTANGPGSGIYGNFKHFNSRRYTPNGWDISYSRDWWKKPEIKERIYKIIENVATKDVDDKLLTIFMED